MEAPNASRSSYKFVLPLIFLVIVGGIASPFLIARPEAQSNWRPTKTPRSRAGTLLREYLEKAQAEEKFKASWRVRDEIRRPGFKRQNSRSLDDPKAPALNGYRFRILTESIEGTWLDKEGRLVG